MNPEKMTDKMVKSLHKLIKDSLAIDDIKKAEEKVYYIRELDDWKELVNDLEIELDKREIEYKTIIW